MTNSKNRNYKEISLNTTDFDTRYLARTYQYEYALYEAIADLFEKVDCRSYIEPLRLYFAELPNAKKGSEAGADNMTGRKNKTTKEDILDEVSRMVERDVKGHVNFPMMHICRAQLSVLPENDGTHTFSFSDGVYGFSVHISVPDKGHPKGIDVNGNPYAGPADKHAKIPTGPRLTICT